MPTTIPTTTSTTRPGSPSTGDAYFETDTNNYIIYDGTAWSVFNNDGRALSAVTNNLSVDFDGTTDYMDFGNNSALMPSAFTISLWLKQDSTYQNTVVQKRTGTDGYQLYFDGGTFNYSGDPTAGTIIFGTNLLTSTGVWYHVAVTHDGSTVKGYVDGDFVSSASSTIASNTANLTLGRHSAGSAYYHDGKIDEFSLHNSALDATNISQIYNDGSPIDLTTNQGNYNGSSSLVGYWRLGDGASDTSSGGGSSASGNTIGTVVNLAASHSDGTVGGGSPEYINDAP